ncbi:MAG: hypothetical protein HYT87_00425 [Nitrospirae bacterium]|nr:hypothetical protein [Nitrospirota bacterium]
MVSKDIPLDADLEERPSAPGEGLRFSEFFEDPFAQMKEMPPKPAPPADLRHAPPPRRDSKVLPFEEVAEAKPEKDEKAKGDEAAEMKIAQITVAKQYQSLRKQLHRFFQEVEEKGAIVDMDGIIAPLTEIMAHLQDHEDFYVYRVFSVSKGDYEADPLLYHSIDVSLLSAVLASSLGFASAAQMLEIALSAILADVGMLITCKDLWSKTETLTEEDLSRLHEHPIASFKLLKPVKGRFHFLDLVVLQIHEREDGSGYPNRLTSAQIHPFAKIIGLCDMVESLTHPRSWRDAHTPYDMVKILLAEGRKLFDPKILKRFLQRITPFPPGTLVQLNTGEFGHVIRVNRDNPLRPVIHIGGTKRGDAGIDLKKSPLLYVVKSFKPGEPLPAAKPAATAAPGSDVDSSRRPRSIA